MDLLVEAKNEAARCGLALERDERGLALAGDGMTLRVDFRELIVRLKPGRIQRELLVRAAKTKHARADAPLAVDATAGLGADALLLAATGFEVRLFERNPVMAALLEDALRRAADDPQLAGIVARMRLECGDSIAALKRMGAQAEAAPDVVYLDPMFPARQKSAAVKKKFQLLHHLEAPCDDAEALLRAALAAHPRKVVIKRPPKGPWEKKGQSHFLIPRGLNARKRGIDLRRCPEIGHAFCPISL